MAGLIAVGTAAFSNAEPAKFPAKLMPTPPVIDGKVDATEWQAATLLIGLVDQRTGEPMAGEARMYLGYDKEAIYFAAVFSDDKPSEIRANGYRVNEMPEGDDQAMLAIDVTNSLNGFDVFKMNSSTATFFEAAGGRALKREWVGEFFAKGHVTATGWEGEARIPWRLLNLPSKGLHDVRFNIGRHWGRMERDYVHTFFEGSRNSDTPIWSQIDFPAPYVDRSLKLLPYIYAGMADGGIVANSGLDVKTSLTSQIQAIGSINPDFRNIENQILSLDFSRFERLADETRPFFLEGNNYFESAIFASQRISSFDVGSKFYGRLDPRTSFGVMDTFDAAVRDPNGGRGNRNDFVASFERQQDANTTLRFVTTGSSEPGNQNQAYLLRASRNFGSWGLTFRDQGSQDTQQGFGRKSEINASYQNKGLYVEADLFRTAENFAPQLAYVPQTDIHGISMLSFYEGNWDKGPVRSVSTFSRYYVNMRDSRPGLYNRGAFSNLNMRMAQKFWLHLNGSVEDFEGSKDYTWGAGLDIPALSPNLNYGFNFTHGKIAGEKYQQMSTGFFRRWKNRFSTNFTYQVQNYLGVRRQFVGSANYDLDESRSVAGRLIGEDGKLGGYISYRRAGNRGAEYFLILGNPNVARFETSLILKLTIPFELKI